MSIDAMSNTELVNQLLDRVGILRTQLASAVAAHELLTKPGLGCPLRNDVLHEILRTDIQLMQLANTIAKLAD